MVNRDKEPSQAAPDRIPYSSNEGPPERKPSKEMAFLGVIISLLYLANLTFGVIEIPDNLPIVGNVDEVFFSALLFTSLSHLGIRLPWYAKKK